MDDSGQLFSLDALSPKIPSIIVAINGQGPTRRRLMDMGLTPGAQVTIEGTAPLGDPIIVWVRGSRLALRRMEAGQIVVTPCSRQAAGQWTASSPQQGPHRHRRGWGRWSPTRGQGCRRRGYGGNGRNK